MILEKVLRRVRSGISPSIPAQILSDQCQMPLFVSYEGKTLPGKKRNQDFVVTFAPQRGSCFGHRGFKVLSPASPG
jgi:hypothetical protein